MHVGCPKLKWLQNKLFPWFVTRLYADILSQKLENVGLSQKNSGHFNIH